MKRRLLLDVVVRKRTSILELFASKDQTLLIRWDTLLVLNLPLDVFNRVRWFDIEGDCFARQCSDENLHLKGCDS